MILHRFLCPWAECLSYFHSHFHHYCFSVLPGKNKKWEEYTINYNNKATDDSNIIWEHRNIRNVWRRMMETSITLIFAPELSYIFRTSGGGPNCEGRLCFIRYITEIVSWSMYYWSIYWHLSLKSSSGGNKTVGNGVPVIPDRGKEWK